MQYKRLLFPEVGRVEWEDCQLPAEPGPHEIIIQAVCSLISIGTELALYSGTHIGFTLADPPFPMMPHHPGYALVGRVLAVGSQVTNVAPGQRVLAEASHDEIAVVDNRRTTVIPLPDALNDQESTLIRLAYIALSAVRVAPVRLGESVVVYGLGLVGQFAAQLFRLNGASPVIGIDMIPERLQIASQLGIHTVHAGEQDVPAVVREHCRSNDPDVVIEATGSPAVIPLALDLVTRGGRVVLLGSTRGRVELDVYSLIHRNGVRLLGAHESVQQLPAHASRWRKQQTMQQLAAYFAEGRLASAGLITHTFPASQALSIYPALAAHPQAYLGVILDWIHA